MSNLLDTVIDAHGGLDRWNQLDAISARLVQGGALWTIKGQEGVPADVFARVYGRPWPWMGMIRDRIAMLDPYLADPGLGTSP